METLSSSSLLIPRLRLRRTPSHRAQETSDMDLTPVAGPSSARSQFQTADDDDDDDNQPTPRMQLKTISSPTNTYGQNYEFGASTSSVIPSDTPAARLRALLARSSDSPIGNSSTRPFAPSSEPESNSVPSRLTHATPSVVRDNLKDLFSYARREPGGTPQKSRPRSNSFDTSEMDITPVVDREREHHKGKRKSLSDDEVDKPKSNKESESSLRSSHAATFDTLRARLMSSRSQLLDQQLPTAVYDVTSQPSETSSLHADEHSVEERANSNANFATALLVPLETSLSPPSIDVGSLHGTFQLPSHLAAHSNLLDQDSEMQHAMNDFDTCGDVPVPMPGSSTNHSSTTPLRPRSSLSFRASLGCHDQSRRASLELPGSRASSSLSAADFKEQQHSREEERKHQREREWNRPKASPRPATPELQHRHSSEFPRRHSQEIPWTSPSHMKSLSHGTGISRSGSPLTRKNLRRMGSVASLRSFDEDQSSRPSSVSSQADYRDRMSELDKDRRIEREREWNKRHPPPRSSSSLSSSSNHSHTHPIRPPSVTAYSTPTHASIQRRASNSSLNRLSDASSPAGSPASHDSLQDPEEKEEREVTHQRERNWNSPYPKWSTTRHQSHIASGNEVPSANIHLGNNTGRILHASSSFPHLTLDAHRKGLPMDKDWAPAAPIPVHLPQHAVLPSLSEKNGDKVETLPHTTPSKDSAVASRFGWHFSRGRQLPPLDLESSPERPGRSTKEAESSHYHMRTRSSPSPTPSSRPSSRTSGVITSSLIPVRSSKKNGIFNSGSFSSSTPAKANNEETFKKGHRRQSTEFTESVGTIPRQIGTHGAFGDEDMVLASDEESVSEFVPRSTTPDTRPSKLSPEGVPSKTDTEVFVSPPPSPPMQRSLPTRSFPGVSSNEDARLSKALASAAATSFQSLTAESPSKTSQAQEQTMTSSFTPPGTPPLPSLAFQDKSSSDAIPPPTLALTVPPRRFSPNSSSLDFRTPSSPHDLSNLSAPPSSSGDEVETCEADVTPVRPDDDGSANPNYTAMKTPRPPGAWAVTPVPPKRAPRETPPPPPPPPPPPLASPPELTLTVPSSMYLSRANSERGSKREAPGGNGLLTPIPSLSRANSLPLRTLAPLGIPECSTTTVSCANAPSPRSLRKSPSVKVVDAFGRERIDGVPTSDAAQDNVTVRAGSKGAIHSLSSAEIPHTPRVQSKSNIRIVDAMGREIEEEVPTVIKPLFDEDLSVLHDDPPIGRTETLTLMRQTLREWADGLNDEDRSADNLAMNTNHLEELEEVSKAARDARNQLVQTLRVKSVKGRDLMHKYAKYDVGQSRFLPTTVGDNRSFHRGLVWFGVVIQLIFVLVMWRFAHVHARRLFYTVYYDPFYPELNPLPGHSHQFSPPYPSFPWSLSSAYEIVKHEGWIALKAELQGTVRRIGEHAWERWGERPYVGTWPPT